MHRSDTGATSRIRFLDRLQGRVEELAVGMESEQDVVSILHFRIITLYYFNHGSNRHDSWMSVEFSRSRILIKI